jgi:hypothetical protein
MTLNQNQKEYFLNILEKVDAEELKRALRLMFKVGLPLLAILDNMDEDEEDI